MNGISPGSCPIASFHISDVVISGSTTITLVVYPVNFMNYLLSLITVVLKYTNLASSAIFRHIL